MPSSHPPSSAAAAPQPRQDSPDDIGGTGLTAGRIGNCIDDRTPHGNPGEIGSCRAGVPGGQRLGGPGRAFTRIARSHGVFTIRLLVCQYFSRSEIPRSIPAVLCGSREPRRGVGMPGQGAGAAPREVAGHSAPPMPPPPHHPATGCRGVTGVRRGSIQGPRHPEPCGISPLGRNRGTLWESCGTRGMLRSPCGRQTPGYIPCGQCTVGGGWGSRP
jgi:hypothetical protein